MRKKAIRWMVAVLAGLFMCACFGTAVQAADEEQIRQMQQLIQQQQEQLEAQQKVLEELKQKMEGMAAEQSKMLETIPAVTPEKQAVATKEDVKKMVQSGNDKVHLTVSGQVNRAALASFDGENNYYYFVDNDNSSSRFRMVGSADLNDDWSVGSYFEAEFQSNDSNLVNQTDRDPGDANFNLRWFDAQALSKTFGKFYLGKGSSASDNTSEVDLSGTAVVGYSSIADMGGGLIFYDDRRADPTDPISPKVGYGNQITIGNVFNNMDGLGRRNRFRYDSPKFFGFWAQGGLTSGNGGDASLWYADKLGPVKLAGAISYANPSTNNPVIDQIINGSISALWNGFNLTLAAGVTEWDDRQLRAEGKNPRDYDDQELFYAKLGYRHEWFNLGETRLSIDYARNKNVLDNIAFRNKDSDADSVGLMFVQMIDKWATESYLGIRWHSLDDLTSTTDPLAKTDFNDVWAVMAGMRVKF